MQTRFYGLADGLFQKLHANEICTLNYSGERSDFVRFNTGVVRQPGAVHQEYISLRLISGQKHAAIQITLEGDLNADRLKLETSLNKIRALLTHLPDDPHLLINTEPASSEKIDENQLCSSEDMVDEVIAAGQGLDLVGILASGGIYRGFANSLGQKNWFATHNFNLDWSLVHDKDKAVKSGYAGTLWDAEVFNSKMELAKRKLQAFKLPAVTLKPGDYRVFLTPDSLLEILQLLGWGSFSLNAQQAKVSALLKLIAGESGLNPAFHLTENISGGSAPGFQEDGFTRPNSVPLIVGGRYADSLISPRSAREYNRQTNGASASEMPDSLDVSPGDIDENRIIETLDTGIYVGNLWYLNYSDRAACRITGMTRFATFWVEDGSVKGPLNVMRFDDTLYRILGDNLLGLTKERSFMLSASSYFHRSTGSANLPGALIKDFRFTL